ncbi:hypothetical protein Tco_0653136 [Tanacetum coccineum]|uniref:Uncharacterized protein n=1 Tax=Tanacetum coccineum TaxID=301880 RepID=A0ABQ4WZI1_9ASTR
MVSCAVSVMVRFWMGFVSLEVDMGTYLRVEEYEGFGCFDFWRFIICGDVVKRWEGVMATWGTVLLEKDISCVEKTSCTISRDETTIVVTLPSLRDIKDAYTYPPLPRVPLSYQASACSLSTLHFLNFPENSFEVLKLLENSVEVLKILENKLESMKILENKLESLKL